MGVEFLPSLHMGGFPLVKPCCEALIADTEDQLAQLLNGLAFALREHL